MTRRRAALPASVILSLVIVAVLVGVSGRAAATPATAVGSYPPLQLSATTHAAAAVVALGADLSTVAQAYGLTSSELTRRLHDDPGLSLDRGGRLFYVCAAAPELPVTGAPILPPPRATAPLSETFRLHSLPGAARVLYLDFNGGTLSGTVWNSHTGKDVIRCPAWNTEGGAGAFSAAERTVIQSIWQRVAEDYAPFAVDVTTEAPAAGRITRSSAADEYYGTRVLVSPIGSLFGHAAGVGYVGVYDAVDERDYYKPALVFPERIEHNEKCIAEAISHEAGHNLGLSHDGVVSGAAYYSGTGQSTAGWAPIMGAGYARTLSQWSKGEYARANNHEDDLAVMRDHGLPPRTDDHGDGVQTATPLPAGRAPAISGVIATARDADVFSFTSGAGPVKFTVRPAQRGANLDIRADVLTAAGTTLATSNRSDKLAAELTLRLPASGTYYLRVQGVGKGNPRLGGYSDYGSLGQYRVKGH